MTMKTKRPQKKQCSIEKIRSIIKHNLNDTTPPKLRDIASCRAEIESWYDWSSDNFNWYLVIDIRDKNETLKELERIKGLLKKQGFPYHNNPPILKTALQIFSFQTFFYV